MNKKLNDQAVDTQVETISIIVPDDLTETVTEPAEEPVTDVVESADVTEKPETVEEPETNEPETEFSFPDDNRIDPTESVEQAEVTGPTDFAAELIADGAEVADLPDTTDEPESDDTADAAPMPTITTPAQDMATKIEELMLAGKTLVEALAAVVPTTKPATTKINRVLHIQGMNNLTLLKAARKTAYAKKSKSKDNPEALERYQLEIDTATARLNEIISEINASNCAYKKALEYGDTPDGALQYYIQDKENEVDTAIDILLRGLSKVPTKAEIKAYTAKAKPDLTFVPETLRDSFKRRLENRDQRVYTLAQRAQSVTDLTSGTRPFEFKPKDAAVTA